MKGSLQDLLRQAAESASSSRMVFYAQGTPDSPWKEVTYADLLAEAAVNSSTIRHIENFKEGAPVLLRLPNHWDAILWFWSVILAGGIPTLSSPFSNVEEHRHRHLQGLSSLLESPICITRDEAISSFDGPHSFHLRTIESLVKKTNGERNGFHSTLAVAGNDDVSAPHPAFLMLTSGSTGHAKAVEITARQVRAAILGKIAVRQLPKDSAFLNWIGIDHVASLVEIHMPALYLGMDQVHIPAADIVSNPPLFLDLLSRHRVSRSFAPNFFLARLVSTFQDVEESRRQWDLSTLAILGSGGEANDVTTCVEITKLLQRYGAPEDVIMPGFGMTETCAGAIYNLDCPRYDIAHQLASASLGSCIPGIEMRVTEEGSLEVRGEVVFRGYYRNPAATAEAFTYDGWFRTGDRATIDASGHLHLAGRTKEVININGVKFETADVQMAVDQALGSLVQRSVVFSTRIPGLATEQIIVVYVPRTGDIETDIVTIEDRAVRACVLSTASRPLVFALSPKSVSLLPMTTLGKIPRAKMRSLFDEGFFSDDMESYKMVLQRHIHAGADDDTPTAAEKELIEDFVATLPAVKEHLHGANTSILSAGFNSMDLIRLKHRLDQRLGISVSVITLLKNPTARSLAKALDSQLRIGQMQTTATEDASPDNPTTLGYDPVVTLVPPQNGANHDRAASKTPLWLVHPGVGEVLVFLNLSHHLARLECNARPVYALRARGFEPNQSRFSSISETVSAYVAAIRLHQPHGPYALAGYSYGTMLAFEISKVLQETEKVSFLGSFNLPPHIKHRMRQLNWNMCLLHLSQFLDLTTSDYADAVEFSVAEYGTLSRTEALSQILNVSSPARLAALGLTPDALSRWVDVAYGLQSMAVDYEPQGQVRGGMDVFHAIPLRIVAASREEWVELHLKKWEDYVQPAKDGAGGLRFHAVGGEHYTMVGPEFVEGFAETLMKVLEAREREFDGQRRRGL